MFCTWHVCKFYHVNVFASAFAGVTRCNFVGCFGSSRPRVRGEAKGRYSSVLMGLEVLRTLDPLPPYDPSQFCLVLLSQRQPKQQ